MARRDDEDETILLVDGDQVVATWTLRCPGPPGLGTVDELARAHLVAKQLGYSVHVPAPSRAFVELIVLAGLADVLNVALREPGGKAEPGEEPGVEEVVMPDDQVP